MCHWPLVKLEKPTRTILSPHTQLSVTAADLVYQNVPKVLLGVKDIAICVKGYLQCDEESSKQESG